MKFNPAAFVLRHWQFGLLGMIFVITLGLGALAAIPRTENPPVDNPQFLVTAVLPGATPGEVEELVTKPIENAVYGIDGVSEVRSQSSDGVSVTTIDFRFSTDPERDDDAVEREVNQLRGKLPAGLGRLRVEHASPNQAAVMEIALVSDTLPMRRLGKLSERLRERMASVPDVREADVWGVTPAEMRVSLDLSKLAVLGITPDQVTKAVQAAGGEGPIGDIQTASRAFNVEYGGAFRSIDAVRDVAIATRGDAVLHVGDIAKVGWADGETDYITRFDGRRAVLLTARQADGQDVTQISAGLTGALDAFERGLPGGVKMVRPYLQASNVTARLNGLRNDFLIALVLVAITLLPLGIRAAVVVMLAIPLSLLIGVSLLGSCGFTLNQLSIAGFVLAIGILVDDAIVVTENIARWSRASPDIAGAVIGGTGQIQLAVVGCTICLMFAFLPLMALPEASGQFIRSLPVAVIATVGGSLLVSLTAIPLAASLILRRNAHPEGNRLLRALNRGIHRLYAPVLRRALTRPGWALAILLVIAALGIPLVGVIGTSLFPAADTPQFLIRIETAPGSSLSRTNQAVHYVEQSLAHEPSIVWTIGNVGRGSPQTYYNSGQHEIDPAYGEVAVGLRPDATLRRDALIDRLQELYAHYPLARISFVTFVQGPPIDAPIALRISGPDLDRLNKLAARAEKAMANTPDLRDVDNPLHNPRIGLHFVVDEAAVAGLGIRAGALRETLQLALSGITAANFRDNDGDSFPVKLRLPMAANPDLADLGLIYIPTTGGRAVPLAAIARRDLESETPQIERLNRMRSVTLTANVRLGALNSRATAAAVANVRAAVPLPPGYSLSVGGEAEKQSRSLGGGLLPALLFAAFGILAVLVLEFKSFRMVAVVAGIIPFGLLGGNIALWLTGNSLSFTATIGMIALIGIEIKNSLLLVDFSQQLRRCGLSVREAVEEAGEQRFLPVLLTSATAISGMLPLAWSNSGLYAPLAIVLIGGLVSSTLLSRIATPVLYLLLARRDSERLR